MLMLPPGSMAPLVDFSCIKADVATNIETSLNLVINDSLSDQLLSDPKELGNLKSHCEGMTDNQNLQEFKITDKSGRVVYTSNND